MARPQARALHLVPLTYRPLPVPKQILALEPSAARGRWDFLGRGEETSTGEYFYVWINKTGGLCCLPVARFWA
jgi:hypothetical protein